MRTLLPVLLVAALGCAPPATSSAPAPSPKTVEPQPEPAATVAPALPPLKITFVDVNEGDAILIQAGDFDALVDTGPGGAWDGQLDAALATVNGPLELLVVSHPHEGHLGQADKVLAKLQVLRVITSGETRGPPREATTPAFFERYTAALAAEGLVAEPANLGESFDPAPGLRLEVLATAGRVNDPGSGSDINNDSLVLRLTYAGRAVLLPGNIEIDAGDWLVQTHCPTDGACPKLEADVFKVPHHGSAHFSEQLIERAKPGYAVISAGFHEQTHCLPRQEAYHALKLVGAKVFSTSAEGVGNVSVTITPDGNMTWSTPNEPVFVWEGMKGRTCIGPAVFEQG